MWDIRTGKRLRGFASLGQTHWPVFHWSHDEKYLARVGTDVISIYQTPSMDLLEQRALMRLSTIPRGF